MLCGQCDKDNLYSVLVNLPPNPRNTGYGRKCIINWKIPLHPKQVPRGSLKRIQNIRQWREWQKDQLRGASQSKDVLLHLWVKLPLLVGKQALTQAVGSGVQRTGEMVGD